MDKIKIIFVSHCILNRGSKVICEIKRSNSLEENNRKKFMKIVLDKDICVVQLPCPEFNMYGSSRWGHTKEQFDNPFFKAGCRKMLDSYILQMEEYINSKDKFEVLGIVGIDGSPSCGINCTCSGQWGGEMSRREDLDQVIKTVHRVKEMGVFMKEIEKCLKEEEINLPMLTLSEAIEIINTMDREVLNHEDKTGKYMESV